MGLSAQRGLLMNFAAAIGTFPRAPRTCGTFALVQTGNIIPASQV